MIAAGLKTIEIRSKPWRHRGPVVICASRRVAVVAGYSTDDLPTGVTVCVVDLVDTRPATALDAGAAMVVDPTGRWAWVLANPRRLPAVAVSGQLAPFTLAADVVAALGLG
jgi:hypothetical protein